MKFDQNWSYIGGVYTHSMKSVDILFNLTVHFSPKNQNSLHFTYADIVPSGPACYCLNGGGGSNARKVSIYPPAISVRHRWSVLRLVPIWCSRCRMRPWLRAGYRCTETLVLICFLTIWETPKPLQPKINHIIYHYDGMVAFRGNKKVQ